MKVHSTQVHNRTQIHAGSRVLFCKIEGVVLQNLCTMFGRGALRVVSLFSSLAGLAASPPSSAFCSVSPSSWPSSMLVRLPGSPAREQSEGTGKWKRYFKKFDTACNSRPRKRGNERQSMCANSAAAALGAAAEKALSTENLARLRSTYQKQGKP